MKILVFGSTGLIGTALETICRKKGIDYVGLGHQDVDATDEQAVRKRIEEHAPTVVVNAVVIIGPPCEEDPLKAFEVNTMAAYYMAKTCAQRDIIFIQPSSHAVFDGTYDGFYAEDASPKPMNVYSGTKYLSEVFAANLCPKHYVVRFPTMFGPRRNQKPGFVDKMLARIQKGEELKVADDKIDSMTYSIDAAGQLIWMLEQNAAYGAYHLANAGQVSYYDFIKKLLALLGASNKLIRAKASDFAGSGHQSLKTAMKSEKLPAMRRWDEALAEYVSQVLAPNQEHVIL